MITNPSVAGRSSTMGTTPLANAFPYETIAIYPNPAELAKALKLLNKEGYTKDQLSILGREQQDWNEKLKKDLGSLDNSDATTESGTLAIFSGVAIAVGVALTGGIGLLAAGPIAAYVAAVGMGAMTTGVLGGVVAVMDNDHAAHTITEEVKNAILKGEWVLVVHSNNEEDAKRIEALLPGSKSIHLESDKPAGQASLNDSQNIVGQA
ncbi:MAG: hypothetical protein V4443_08720 [Pseudomonadota bacterium]